MPPIEVIIVGNTTDAEQKIGGLGSSFANLGSIVSGIRDAFDLVSGAIQGVISFGSQFTDAAIESQNAIAELEAVLSATGGAAGLTSQELQNMATELSQVTAFSDEAVMGGQSMLLTFKNIGEDVFPRATAAMLDMGQMFGSVDAASVQLGKALNDPIAGISALSRIGVTFSEVQKEQIKNFMEAGDIMSAQNIILTELESQIGGVAEAYGETFAGKLEIAKNAIGEITEGIGGLILRGLTPLLDLVGPETAIGQGMDIISETLAKLNDYLEKGMPLFQSLGIIFMNLSHDADLEGIAGNLQSIGGAFLQMQDVLEGGGSMWDAAIVGIGNFSEELANLLIDLQNSLESDGVVGVLESLALALANAITSVDWAGIASTIDEKLSEGISSHDWAASGESFANAIGEMFKPGEGDWSDVNSDKWAWLDNMPFMIAARFIKAVFSSDTAASIGEALRDWIQGAFDAINTAFPFDVEAFAQSIGDGIIEGLNNLDFQAQYWVDTHIIDPIKRALGIASPSSVFFEIGRNIVLGLIGGFSSMIGSLVTIVSGIVDAVLAIFQPVLDVLGIDIGGTGSTGGRTVPLPGPDGSTTGTTGGGTVINQYFSGATINVGSWDEIAYDCIYPNPFIVATGGMLGGSGGSTGGGGTVGR